MASGKSIPTLNRCGFQMATPCPLFEEWVLSYDNIHPLLDVGCAFGVNTFEALKRGIPTIALDMDEGHLDFIRKTLTADNEQLATCVFGFLPDNIPLSDNSVSGILASEVFHFLIGNDIEESLITLQRKLVVGGKLVFTVLSDKNLTYLATEERQALFYHDLNMGVKWPGVCKVDDALLTRLARFMKADGMKEEFRKHMSEDVQFFSQSQMISALERTGFEVKMSKYARHPGYPDPEGLREIEGLNLQVIAEKRQMFNKSH